MSAVRSVIVHAGPVGGGVLGSGGGVVTTTGACWLVVWSGKALGLAIFCDDACCPPVPELPATPALLPESLPPPPPPQALNRRDIARETLPLANAFVTRDMNLAYLLRYQKTVSSLTFCSFYALSINAGSSCSLTKCNACMQAVTPVT
jgi:hypothetical protein